MRTSVPQLDLFTSRRIKKFVETFRTNTGQLPTLKDFAQAGFDQDTVELGIKNEILEQFYVTLSNGSIVKTFKLKT